MRLPVIKGNQNHVEDKRVVFNKVQTKQYVSRRVGRIALLSYYIEISYTFAINLLVFSFLNGIYAVI